MRNDGKNKVLKQQDGVGQGSGTFKRQEPFL